MSAENRIRKELEDIKKDPPSNCSAGMEGEDIYNWEATVMGPAGSVYEGGVFHLSIKFPKNYPFSPDFFAVNGNSARRHFEDFNYPTDKVIELEALRYLKLESLSDSNNKKGILILGSIVKKTTLEMLNIILPITTPLISPNWLSHSASKPRDESILDNSSGVSSMSIKSFNQSIEIIIRIALKTECHHRKTILYLLCHILA